VQPDLWHLHDKEIDTLFDQWIGSALDVAVVELDAGHSGFGRSAAFAVALVDEVRANASERL